MPLEDAVKLWMRVALTWVVLYLTFTLRMSGEEDAANAAAAVAVVLIYTWFKQGDESGPRPPQP